MYGAHYDVYDLHASYEHPFVKKSRKRTFSLVTSGTREVPFIMQGCTLLSVLFLRREDLEPLLKGRL